MLEEKIDKVAVFHMEIFEVISSVRIVLVEKGMDGSADSAMREH